MENKVFKYLEDKLNFDCAMIINSYYVDLQRMDLLKAFRRVYPTEIELWKHINYDNSITTFNSRAILHNPETNVRIATIRMYSHYNIHHKCIYHMNQSMEKFLYVNGKQYRVCCNYLTKLNARSDPLCYQHQDKEMLFAQCKENGIIKAYKSWTKKKLIQALLKV